MLEILPDQRIWTRCRRSASPHLLHLGKTPQLDRPAKGPKQCVHGCDLTSVNEPVIENAARDHEHEASDTVTPPSFRLLDLPQELQLQIFQDSHLYLEDMRHLRLTARRIHTLVTGISGDRYLSHLRVFYDPQRDRPTETQRQLTHILASPLCVSVEQITFDLLEMNPESSLKEANLPERRREEDREQRKRGECAARKSKEQADYSGLEHITVLHQNGMVHDLTKVVAKATCLETFKLHGLVPFSWPKDRPFHLAPQRHFDVEYQDCIQVDEVLESLATTRLTTIDLFHTRLSMESLFVLLLKQQKTLSTLVLDCSMVLDGQWSDLLLHMCRVRTLKCLRINALHIGSSDTPNLPRRVSDLDLEGHEAIVAKCKSLVRGERR
jgi:hypothetical protein